MTTEHIALKMDSIDRLYDKLIGEGSSDWYAVTDDEMLVGAEPENVAEQLRRRGLAPSDFLICRMPGPPPYLVR